MVIALGTLMAAPVGATPVGFKFDANKFIQESGTGYTTEGKATQDNPRRVHKTWTNEFYQTFNDYLASGTVQPDSGNTYANWAAGLGSGEGITAFNIWLLDNPAAQSWGETLVTDPNGIMPVGFAPHGWNVETIANPWGPGWLVQWWTQSLGYAINNASTLGMFGFNADVYEDTGPAGYDPTDSGAAIGDSYRIWFGSYWGAQPSDWDPDNHSLAFDDAGWGSLANNYGTFQPAAGADGSNVGWEGVLELEAGQPIPEPGTLLLLGSGLAGLAGYGKLRFRRKRK
jgi:hypothetical protein